MKIKVLKTHMNGGQFVRAGSVVDVSEGRAKELVRNSIAAVDDGEPVKEAPTPSNNAARAPKRK